ncbi:hypothetical protein ACI65C_006741 [Semiaphis heraclei]
MHPKRCTVLPKIITELVFNYIVEEMRPIVTCEKQSFHRLIQGLTGITDSTLLPNHKNISKLLQLKTSKITHIITDNASNFGKAFRTFSKSSTNESDPHYVGNLDELESDDDTQVDSDDENNLPSPI